METPSKKPKISSMTHEEEEEMKHNISQLQDQVQHISLSQKVTKSKINGLKKCVEAKMDGMEANMDGLEVNIEDLKKGVEGLKGGLAKLLQEMLPNGKKVVEQTHNENKINVSHDFIESNVERKTHHVPNIDMRKFDGEDPVTWIL